MLDKILRVFKREDGSESHEVTRGPVFNVKNTFLHFDETVMKEDDTVSRRARSASPPRSAPRSEPEVVRVKPRKYLKSEMKKIASAPVALCDLIHLADKAESHGMALNRNALSCHDLYVIGIEEGIETDSQLDSSEKKSGRSASPTSTLNGDDDMHRQVVPSALLHVKHSVEDQELTPSEHKPSSAAPLSPTSTDDKDARTTLAFHIYDMMEQKGFGGTDAHLLMDVYMEVWTHLMGGATTGGKLALERFASFLVANEDLFEVFERRILRLPHSIEVSTMKEKTASRFTHKERMVRLKERPDRQTQIAASA
jgi:hypothetical protein